MRDRFGRVWAAALLVAALAGPVGAQSVEELEEATALGLVEAVRAGDIGALLQYMHDHWIPPAPDSDRENRWPRLARTLVERHSDLLVTGVTIERPHEVTVIASDPDGPELRLIFTFEAEVPHRIRSMGLEAGLPRPRMDLPPLELPAGADTGRMAAVLGTWFDGLAAEDRFSGTVLVAREGQAFFSGAWGFASKRWQVPNRLDTRFDLGSINKSFTQIAVGQLLAAGRLSLDDPIARHLPDYPNPEVARQVTVRHLLDHTSGLGDIFTEEFFRSSKALYRTPRDFFPLFAHRPLAFAPGTGQSYSNAGYIVLGAVIEAVSGEPYDEYVRAHIFAPAGMERSGFFARDEPVANVAEGYTRQGPGQKSDVLRSNVLMLPVKGSSAGSAQSTVGDLLRFDNALREHRLLPPAWTAWYFGGEEPGDAPAADAGGKRSGAATGIAGGAPGVSAVLESDGDLAVIVLSNYDPPAAEQVGRTLFRALRDALPRGE